MNTTPQSGADILARIQPRLRRARTQICMRSDLLDAWEDANQELMAMQQRDVGTQRLASGGASNATQQQAQAVQEIEAQIEDASLWVEFEAMPKDDWTVLCEQHPPRSGNDMDMIVGYNRDAVADASVRACMVDPAFDDASWAQFVRVCNPGEWAELRNSAAEVNRAVTSVPKSVWAERALSKHDADSKSPASGE